MLIRLILIAVLREGGINIEKEEEVDIYLEDRYDEVAESLAENPDAEILTKADVPEEKEEKLRVKSDDWWLAEDAFAVKPSGNANPFAKTDK